MTKQIARAAEIFRWVSLVFVILAFLCYSPNRAVADWLDIGLCNLCNDIERCEYNGASRRCEGLCDVDQYSPCGYWCHCDEDEEGCDDCD